MKQTKDPRVTSAGFGGRAIWMMLVNPILNRELVTYLRRRRAFLVLFLYLVFLCLVALAHWISAAESGFAAGRDDAMRGLFLFCAYTQLGAAALLAVVIAGGQIKAERNKRTFDILITTPLRAHEILIGKVLASVGYVLLLILAAIPIYSLCFLFGGVGWSELFAAFYLTLLTGVTYGMVGIASSVLPPRTRRKDQMGDGLGIVLFLNGLFALMLAPFLYYVLSVPGDLVGAISSAMFFLLSPFAVFHAMTSFPGGPVFRMGARNLLIVHSVAQICVFLFFLWLGCRRLRREIPAVVSRVQTRAGGAKKSTARRRQWPFPIPDYLNPVAAKDLLLMRPQERLHRIFAQLFVVALFIFLAVCIVWSRREWANPKDSLDAFNVATLIAVGLAAFISFVHATTTVVSELEKGTLGLLAIVPLRPRHVMRGKLISVVLGLSGGLFLFCAGLVVVYCLSYLPCAPVVISRIPLAFAALIATCANYAALGVWVSAGSPSQRSATTRAIVLCVLAYVLVVPSVGVLLYEGGPVVAATAAAIVFPALFVFLPEAGWFPHAEWLRWLFFLFGIGISFALASLWLRLAARTYARRIWQSQEKTATAR